MNGRRNNMGSVFSTTKSGELYNYKHYHDTIQRQQHIYNMGSVQMLKTCLCEGNEQHDIVIVPDINCGQHDIILKCVFLGYPGTGKTLLSSCIKNGKIGVGRRDSSYNPTLSVDFQSIVVQHTSNIIKMQCWDVGGVMNKLFLNIYLSGAKIVFLFCDLYAPQRTLDWLKCVDTHSLIHASNKIFLICDQHLAPGDSNFAIIKQLQTDIMTMYPTINVVDAFIFDYCDLSQFIGILDSVFKHVYVDINDHTVNNKITTKHHVSREKPTSYVYDKRSIN